MRCDNGWGVSCGIRWSRVLRVGEGPRHLCGGRYPLGTSREFSSVDAIGQFLYQSLKGEHQKLQAVVMGGWRGAFSLCV